MKLLIRILVALIPVVAIVAVAQATQPTPDSSNQNRNEPSIHIQGQAGATAKQGSDPGTLNPGSQTESMSGNSTQQNSNPPNPATNGGQPAQDQQPQTQILPGVDAPGSADPLLEPAPLPEGATTLVGGIAEKVDGVRNRVRVQPFGGGKRMDIRFDERSHFYRDGRETTILGIKPGDRVYADTMLVGGKIFARNLRVQTESGPAEARGQVTNYDAASGTVTMQDQLTSQPVRFAVSSKTPVARDNAPTSISELRPGAMIDVLFSPQGRTGDAQRIDILALPGANYMFVGRVTNVDMRAGTLAIDNQSDNKNYEIHFDAAKVPETGALKVGAEVAANTVFDGQRYTAQTVTVNPSATAQQ